ncbi:MAG TPA: hypothetical protein P5571_11525 [Candidatus Krumholzibacteria bacterium]|mgnify:CR=1 FL=1|nr:hypothetical protein [Candidatus Krumholzibacteria bacterium]HRX51988.1 hypothetical protein [Candidatus Krumholzibacteria bacterium]
MIRTLMRLDAGSEDTGKHMLMAVGICSLLGLIASSEANLPVLFSRQTTGGWRLLEAFMLWIVSVAMLVGSKAWVRAPGFLLGLPIPACQMLKARLLSQALHGALVLGAGLLAASLRWDGGPPSITLRAWDAYPMLLAMHLFMLVIPSAIEPVRQRLTMNGPMMTLLGMGWLLMLIMTALVPWHPAVGAMALTLAVAAMTVVIGRVRGNFELETDEVRAVATEAPAAPRAVSADAPSVSFHALRPARTNRLLLGRTLLRLMHDHWLGWLFPVVLFVYGLGLVKNFREGDDSLFYGIYVIFFFLGAMAQSLKRLHRVDAWPVARRTLYWLALGPSLLGFGIGLGAGLVLPDHTGPVINRPGVVDVPHEFKGLARDGEVPPTVAPWGESHTPRGYPVVPGLAWRVYRPFEYGPDSSPRFLAWVSDQALARVLDAPADGAVPVAYAEMDSARVAKIREKRYMLEASRNLPATSYARAVAAETLAMILIGTGLSVLSLLGFHAGWDQRRKKLAMLGTIIPFTVAGLLALAQLTGWSAMWVAPAAAMILIRETTDAVGGAPWTWWLATAAAAAAAFLILQERFVRGEANLEDCRRRGAGDF